MRRVFVVEGENGCSDGKAGQDHFKHDWFFGELNTYHVTSRYIVCIQPMDAFLHTGLQLRIGVGLFCTTKCKTLLIVPFGNQLMVNAHIVSELYCVKRKVGCFDSAGKSVPAFHLFFAEDSGSFGV